MIPKVFHYVWVGGKPLPEGLKHNIETWRKFNPDFQIMQWDESNIDFSSNFIRRSYRLGYWARVADYARIDILVKHGGIYLDTDIKITKNFEPLMSKSCFLGYEDDNGTVNNAVIGAVPQHWLLTTALSRITNTKTGLEKMDASVGPGLFTELLNEAGYHHSFPATSTGKDIFIAPKRYFYPYGWNEEFQNTCITSDTYCVHLWEKSWVQKGIKKDLTAKLQTILRLYPSLFRHKYPSTALEIAVWCTEAFSTKGKSLSRTLPW